MFRHLLKIVKLEVPLDLRRERKRGRRNQEREAYRGLFLP